MVRDSGLWSFFLVPLPSYHSLHYTRCPYPCGAPTAITVELSSPAQTFNLERSNLNGLLMLVNAYIHLPSLHQLASARVANYLSHNSKIHSQVNSQCILKTLWLFILFRVNYQTRELYALNAPVLLTQFSAHPSIWFQNDILRPMTSTRSSHLCLAVLF